MNGIGWQLGRLIAIAGVGAMLLSGCSSFGGIAGKSAFGDTAVSSAEVAAATGNDANATLGQARAFFRNADYGQSAAYYKRLVQLQPTSAEGYVGLGASYDELGRFDLSDRVYAALYGITGATAQYFNNVGYSYLLRGNMAAALSNFRKAQKLDPENVRIANNIQMLMQASGRA